jgi:hypothetical protein
LAKAQVGVLHQLEKSRESIQSFINWNDRTLPSRDFRFQLAADIDAGQNAIRKFDAEFSSVLITRRLLR